MQQGVVSARLELCNIHATQDRHEETPYDNLVNRQQIITPRCQQESGLARHIGSYVPKWSYTTIVEH